MFEFIIQIVLDVLLEILGAALVEVLVSTRRIPWVDQAATKFVTGLILFAVGAFIGWVSLWIFPNAIVRSESLHGISLVITPVLTGATMVGLGWLLRERQKPVIRLGHFAIGYVVALGMALVRFYLTD